MALIRRNHCTDLASFPPIPNVIDFIDVSACLTKYCWEKREYTVLSRTQVRGVRSGGGLEWEFARKESPAFALRAKIEWWRNARDDSPFREIFESRCHQQRIDVAETRHTRTIEEIKTGPWVLECYYSFAGVDWNLSTVLWINPHVAMQLLGYAKTLRNEPLTLESLKLASSASIIEELEENAQKRLT